jgi:hypothetical protein
MEESVANNVEYLECSQCHLLKANYEFYEHPKNKSKRQSYCKACQKLAAKRSYHKRLADKLGYCTYCNTKKPLSSLRLRNPIGVCQNCFDILIKKRDEYEKTS